VSFVLTAVLAQIPPAPVRFSIEPIPKTAAELSKRFTPEQIDMLEKLNRRDREHMLRADPPTPGIVVPLAWEPDELTYSPFPAEWLVAAEVPKYLVVHQPTQAFAAYEYGKLVKWGPVSSGRKETATPPGSYNLTWRSRSRRSTDNDAWLLEWYFNFINERGISFHQFELPGYAASHACVRLLKRDAQWVYAWGEQWTLSADKRKVDVPGTPVLIIGEFAHGKPGPWTSLDALAVLIELPLPAAPR
jgi:lipoprotein-anchoring transpeptidase ErfK/SrfK